ncbi:hypothetical protein V6237_00280 [Pseudoalteromonas carrageenovora]|uniref:DUF7079 family protein n=1 Tax=Pseudoalteromonas carrageenovora TaxID=227 RepID=UPI00311E61A4
MDNPRLDSEDRKPIWDALQMFWMDIEPSDELENAIATCARSKYSIVELEYIYWNEVYPVVRQNFTQLIPEWTGYDIEQLSKLIIANADRVKRTKYKLFHFRANYWWKEIASGITKYRKTRVNK